METRALQLPPTILFEKRDHIAIVTINRPDAMNALTKEMLLGIDHAFAEIDADPELWVSILTAAGARERITPFMIPWKQPSPKSVSSTTGPRTPAARGFLPEVIPASRGAG